MMQAAKNNDLNQFETLNQLAKDYLSTLIENRKKKINVRLMHKKTLSSFVFENFLPPYRCVKPSGQNVLCH